MNGERVLGVAGIEELKKIERFSTANFPEDDSVGPMPK